MYFYSMWNRIHGIYFKQEYATAHLDYAACFILQCIIFNEFICIISCLKWLFYFWLLIWFICAFNENKKSGWSHCILGYGSAHSILWLCTPHLKKKKSISLSYNIPECSEPHRSTCRTSIRSMLVFQTHAVICFSLILCRNLSKKYQPKKKEEDENKYV